MQPRPYQREAIDATWTFLRYREGNPCIVLPTGCHARGTRILMADGSTKAVEDVAVGDQVMGPWSAPRAVLKLIRGREQMFKITPKKGAPFVVNGNHVLSLRTTNEGKGFPCNMTGEEIEAITVFDYIGKSKSWKHLRKLWRASVNFPANARPDLDPWALGALIGDGCLIYGTHFSNPDPEILDGVWQEMTRHGLRFTRTHKGNCWHVKFCGNGWRSNHVFKILDELGLARKGASEKFIPDAYKLGSREDRLNILAGLLDTDGYHDGRGGYDYISKSRQLSEDVTFVARSLGLAAYCSPSEKRCQTGAGGTYWRVHISGHTDMIPIRCERKKAPVRRQKKSPLVTGFSVEPVGHDEFFGFTLDGDHLYLTDDFTVHHNSGKTVVMAEMIREALTQWSGTRICVLAHTRELVGQNADKLYRHWPAAPIGINAAGLGRRDRFEPVIFASIQSVAKHAMQLGRFDMLLIDEGHRIPLRGEGQYREFITGCQRANPQLRVAGLTATPYRLGGGPVCGPDYVLTDIAYEAGVGDLIRDGFLSRLVSKAGVSRADLSGVRVRNGDYVAGELERACDQSDVVEAACDEIVALCAHRRAWIVFCAGVAHAQHVNDALVRRGVRAAMVDGTTPTAQRDAAIGQFQRGELRALVNVNVLSEGFDATHVDAVVLMRPTKSAGLYYQQCGRGLRLHPGKVDCLVLDFAGNITEHGPIDAIVPPRKPGEKAKSAAPVRTCPQCQTHVPVQTRVCACGWQFPDAERKLHDATASEAAILSEQIAPEWHDVTGVHYARHDKPGSPPSLRVTYACSYRTFREWVCLEHSGMPRARALTWWMTRAGAAGAPKTIDEALTLTDNLRVPARICVREHGKYPEIVNHGFDDTRDARSADRSVA